MGNEQLSGCGFTITPCMESDEVFKTVYMQISGHDFTSALCNGINRYL